MKFCAHFGYSTIETKWFVKRSTPFANKCEIVFHVIFIFFFAAVGCVAVNCESAGHVFGVQIGKKLLCEWINDHQIQNGSLLTVAQIKNVLWSHDETLCWIFLPFFVFSFFFVHYLFSIFFFFFRLCGIWRVRCTCGNADMNYVVYVLCVVFILLFSVVIHESKFVCANVLHTHITANAAKTASKKFKKKKRRKMGCVVNKL